MIDDLASRFGDSWWQEVTLVFLAQAELQMVEAFLKAVVALPRFAGHGTFMDACLEDAGAISMVPFLDVLKLSAEENVDRLWARQGVALRIVERHDLNALSGLRERLSLHPDPAISAWVASHPDKDMRVRLAKGPVPYELVRIPGGAFMMGETGGAIAMGRATGCKCLDFIWVKPR